jgi:Rieske Fe-S protein
MSTTRRVFLTVIGVEAAAACALPFGCGGAGSMSRGGGNAGGGGVGGSGGTPMTPDAGGGGGGAGGGPANPTDAGGGPGADDLIGASLDELSVVGTILQVPGEWFAVARDARGLYALELLCTHLGCEVAPSGAGDAIRIDCPCHGSSFDGNGLVLRGPATRPLTHLAVDIDADGNVVIHTTAIVDPTVRLAG